MGSYKVICKYYDKIVEEMIDCYRDVIGSGGSIQYKIYIWEDGEIERLYGVQGDNTYLRPNKMESRELYYVTTIDAPCFDAWDCADRCPPDDEEQRKREYEEIIEWLVDEYSHNQVYIDIESAIDDARRWEEYERMM